MSMKIYIMAHKPFDAPSDPLYIPLQVGRAISPDLGWTPDNTGEHISYKNPTFCELTGMYWIWKNAPSTDYIGICHYRRYLINARGRLFTEHELSQILSHYDIVTTKLLTLPVSYKEGFRRNHHEKDLQTTLNVLYEKYPQDALVFERLIHENRTYFGNIFVTSAAQYQDYCSWLFDILLEVERRTDMTGYNNYQRRLYGFLAEFLQTVYIESRQMRTYECKVGMTGEKHETQTMCENIARFFEKGEYLNAGLYFRQCYAKRPDILMEASDIYGELRICMQIIATCSYEADNRLSCLLDSIHDYPALLAHCRRLNSVCRHFLHHCETDKDIAFLRDTACITPEAVAISLKMFAPSSACLANAAKSICQALQQPRFFANCLDFYL